MIHVHCFTKSDPPEKEITERLAHALGTPISLDKVDFHFVRKVAPSKEHLQVSLDVQLIQAGHVLLLVPVAGRSSFLAWRNK